MTGNGKEISDKALVFKNGRMEHIIRVNGKEINQMVKENLLIQMVIIIKDNGY